MTLDLTKIPKTKPDTWPGVLAAWGLTSERSLRYSDDQPRDDHGRWTSDGGGDESSTSTDLKLPPGWEKKGLGQGYLVNASTKTMIRDLDGKPIPQFVVDSVADLQTRFPVNVAGLTVNIDYSMSDDIGGATTSPLNVSTGEREPGGYYSIRMNGDLMNGGTDFMGADLTERWRTAAVGNSIMPSAADDPARYCIYHEYGHVLDNSTGANTIPQLSKDLTQAEADYSQSVSNLSETGEAGPVVRGMSKYAQYLPGEGMAEGFADYAITNGKTTNPFSLQVIKALQTAGAIK